MNAQRSTMEVGQLPFFPTLNTRLVRLLIAVCLLVPGGLSLSTAPTLASTCTWSNQLNDEMVISPAYHVSITSDTTFQVLLCGGTPSQFYVISEWEQAVFQDKYTHAWTQWGVCQIWRPGYCKGVGPGVTYVNWGCAYSNGKCTITHLVNIGWVFPYNISAIVWSHWYNCASPGNEIAKCDIDHQFFEGNIYAY